MPESDDQQLLRDYAERNSEPAFAALVVRHLNLVHSVALRQTGNPHDAEEIAQAVFIILARKAKQLRRGVVLSSWLYQTARLTAINFQRAKLRRARREQEAYVQSLADKTETEVWPQIAPILEQAMGRLSTGDRDAVVLRFFEGKSLGEVGGALGISSDAAKMRVNRALEKLRRQFGRQGVVVSTATIAGAVSAHAVQGAPAGLAGATAASATLGAGTAPTVALAKATLDFMSWAKVLPFIAAAIALVLIVSTVALMPPGKLRTMFGAGAANSGPLLIVPRERVGDVRAGMTTDEVVAVLGEPDRRTGRILHYVHRGFSVIPNSADNHLRAVFCGSSVGVEGPMTSAFKGRTAGGIGMGSTRAEVIRALGPPTVASSILPGQEYLGYEPLDLTLTLRNGRVVYLVVNF